MQDQKDFKTIQKELLEKFKNAQFGASVHILDSVEWDETKKKYIVSVINAKVASIHRETPQGIRLAIPRETSDGPTTFYCNWPFEAFMFERYDRQDNRFDVQLRESHILTEYQEKWLDKNQNRSEF